MADHILSDRDLDAIFRTARSHNAWAPTPISDVQLEALYDLLRMGPTATNGSPARCVFCRSDAARATLADCVSAGNRDKVLEAPVTAIVGMDIDFHERLPQLFPHNLEARDWFADPEARREAALRNSSLQGAYMIVAARAIGLDCGPMSGFDKAKVDAAFFAGTRIEANFICSIGHGTDERLFARSPRLSFAEACRIA